LANSKLVVVIMFVFTVDSDFLQGVKKVFGSDEKKEFVDPYFIAGFAGTKVSVTVFSYVNRNYAIMLSTKQMAEIMFCTFESLLDATVVSEKQFYAQLLIVSHLQVYSRIMYNSDHPHWNQELRLGLHV